MSAATMARKKDDIPPPSEKKKSSLKVAPADQQIVAKVAAHRGLSIEELFKEKDVQEFFRHLLLAEMKKEETRLTGQNPK